MKFSATDWSFCTGDDPVAYYAAIAAAGIGAVEMVPRERMPAARAAGLEIITISGGGMEVGLNRPANHDAVRASIMAAIELAAGEGIGQVIVFSGNRGGQADAEGVEQVARGLEPCLVAADEAGVDLIFEMLNSVDHVDYQADSFAFGRSLMERCRHPRLRLLYDIYHMARMGEPYCEQLRRHADLIGHVHIAGHPGRGFPGVDQEIDYAAALAACAAGGYDGWYGLEFLPDGDPVAALQQAVALLQTA